MNTLTLGTTGQRVSIMGLGCMGMSEFYGRADQDEAIATVHDALDAGVTMLDTADIYGMGRNETLLAQVLKERRDDVLLATKFGIVRDDHGNFVGENGRSDYVQAACERSLTRLGIDVIDLYYQHRVDAEVPIEETVGAMARLVEQGKARYLGLSEASPATVRRAHEVHPITALQTEYSLWSREPERELFDLCRELGITFVAYSPLGRGLLTGLVQQLDALEADDRRHQLPRFQGENFDHNCRQVEHLTRLAKAKGVTAAQMALAWVHAQNADLVSLPGTKRRTYLHDNLRATDIVLTVEESAALEAFSRPGAAAGERYGESGMRAVNR